MYVGERSGKAAFRLHGHEGAPQPCEAQREVHITMSPGRMRNATVAVVLLSLTYTTSISLGVGRTGMIVSYSLFRVCSAQEPCSDDILIFKVVHCDVL